MFQSTRVPNIDVNRADACVRPCVVSEVIVPLLRYVLCLFAAGVAFRAWPRRLLIPVSAACNQAAFSASGRLIPQPQRTRIKHATFTDGLGLVRARSTLLESGNHYSTLAPMNAMSWAFIILTKRRDVATTGKMFELTDSLGKKLFETISITLVCGKLFRRPT